MGIEPKGWHTGLCPVCLSIWRQDGCIKRTTGFENICQSLMWCEKCQAGFFRIASESTQDTTLKMLVEKVTDLRNYKTVLATFRGCPDPDNVECRCKAHHGKYDLGPVQIVVDVTSDRPPRPI